MTVLSAQVAVGTSICAAVAVAAAFSGDVSALWGLLMLVIIL